MMMWCEREVRFTIAWTVRKADACVIVTVFWF